MFTFLFTKKGENALKFATQPYGISLSLFKVAAKLPDEGIARVHCSTPRMEAAKRGRHT